MLGSVRRSYVLQACAWPAGLEAELARIDGDVPPAWYRDEHDAGRLALSAVVELGSAAPLCHVLTRTEPEDFVVVAAVSHRSDHAMTALVLPLLEAVAVRRGCSAVRIHTRRWGLAAIAGEIGYAIAEIVLRKRLSDGR